MVQACAWTPSVNRSAHVAGDSGVFAFQTLQKRAAFFARVLENAMQDADCRNETVLSLDGDDPLCLWRLDCQAA